MKRRVAKSLLVLRWPLMRGHWISPLFPFLAECLWLYVEQGVPLARALCVEGDKSAGGAPLKYDPIELAAVDLLLRDHAGFSPAEAVAHRSGRTSALTVRPSQHGGRRLILVTGRPQAHSCESLSRDDLLRLSGSLREKGGARALAENPK